MRHKLCDYRVWKEKGMRVLPFENYLIFYIVDEINRTVKIYRIIYSKRDIKKQLNDEIKFRN